TERQPARLPKEFRILDIKPGKWTPEIVISRHNGLYRNITQEVQYAQLVHLLGANRARELLHLHPGQPDLQPDAAVDLSLISEAILESYKASRAPVAFRPEDVQPEYRGQSARRGTASPVVASGVAVEPSREWALPDDDLQELGSNNWVISG